MTSRTPTGSTCGRCSVPRWTRSSGRHVAARQPAAPRPRANRPGTEAERRRRSPSRTLGCCPMSTSGCTCGPGRSEAPSSTGAAGCRSRRRHTPPVAGRVPGRVAPLARACSRSGSRPSPTRRDGFMQTDDWGSGDRHRTPSMRTAAGARIVRTLDATTYTVGVSWHAGAASSGTPTTPTRCASRHRRGAFSTSSCPTPTGLTDPLVSTVDETLARRRPGGSRSGCPVPPSTWPAAPIGGPTNSNAASSSPSTSRPRTARADAPAGDRPGHQLVAGEVSSGDALVAFGPLRGVGPLRTSGPEHRVVPHDPPGGQGVGAPAGVRRRPVAEAGRPRRTRQPERGGTVPRLAAAPPALLRRAPVPSSTPPEVRATTLGRAGGGDSSVHGVVRRGARGNVPSGATACTGAGELRQAHHRGPDLRAGLLVVGARDRPTMAGAPGPGT